jgi:hypothetical protein
MASNLAWSIDPNAFLKSIYSRYISCWISLETSKAAISVCSCLKVHRSCLKSSWLFCRIWCFRRSWLVGP